MTDDPTRTKTLREEFARILRKLPDNIRKRVEEILQTAYRIDESTIEQIKQIVEEEMGPQAVEKIIDRYTWLFWQRGAEFASRQLKKFGIELLIPPTLSIIDEETVNQLKNLQLDLIKGLSEEVKKKLAFQIREGLLRGETIRELTKRVQEVTDKIKYEAERIARTEATRVFNQAALDRYRRAGAQYYKYLAAMDQRTCPRCARNYGKIFKIDDPSAPRPPCHPNCRCAIVPVIKFDEENRKLVKSEVKEIAIQKCAEIIAKKRKIDFTCEDLTEDAVKHLLKDERISQLAEILQVKKSELVRQYITEAVKILEQNYTLRGVERCYDRIQAKKLELTLRDLARAKKRGLKIYEDDEEYHVIAKINNYPIKVFVSKEDDKILSFCKIGEKKYEKLRRSALNDAKDKEKRARKSFSKRIRIW